jgi:predicted PurR-regulated permease PerM
VIITTLAVAGLLWLAYVSWGVLTWIAVAAFLAAAIDPIVSFLQKRARVPRAVSILGVYVVGLAIMAGVAFLFIPPLIDAGTGLGRDVPRYANELRDSRLFQRLDEEYDIVDRAEQEATNAASNIGPDTAVELGQRVVNGLLAFISIAVLTFLFSLYGPRMRSWAESQATDARRRMRVARILDRLQRVVAGYVFGVLLIAVIAGLGVWVFLEITGVPFAPLLAFWAGLMSLVPLVGATIGAIPYITVAFFQSWPLGVASIVYLVVYQQIENNLFQPAIHRWTVRLNPLWVIIAVLIGAQVLGITGVLVAIPVAGMLQVFVQEWLAYRREDRGPPTGRAPPDTQVTESLPE